MSPTSPRIIALIYAACFALGALSHALDFLTGGWRPYDIAPLPIEVFWSSLVAIDLVIMAILLFDYRRLGGSLALAVMLTDVAVNTYALKVLDLEILVLPLVMQSIFLGFILGTLRLLLLNDNI